MLKPDFSIATPPGRHRWLYLAPFLVAFALFQQYRARAFSVEDVRFLLQLRLAAAGWLSPAAFSTFYTQIANDFSIGTTHSLAAFPFVIVLSMGHGATPREEMLHCSQFAWQCLALAGTMRLARRVGATSLQSATVGVVVAASPVIGMATAEVSGTMAATACAVWSVHELLAWQQSKAVLRLISFSVLACAAVVVRPECVALGLLVIAILAQRDGNKIIWHRRSIAPIALSLCACGLAFALQPMGSFAELLAIDPFHGSTNARYIVGLSVGWATLTPLVALLVIPIAQRVSLPIVLTFAIAFCALILGVAETRAFEEQMGLGFVGGLTLAVLIGVIGEGGSTTAFGLFAIGVTLSLLPMRAPTTSMLTAATPFAALAWLTSTTNQATQSRIRLRRAAELTIVAISLIASMLILRADEEWTRLPRTALESLVASYRDPGVNIWVGGDMANQWYGRQAGALTWNNQARPKPRDLFIGPFDFRNSDAQPGLNRPISRVDVLRPFEYSSLRSMSRRRGAGLREIRWGLLPLAWDKSNDVSFAVWAFDYSRMDP